MVVVCSAFTAQPAMENRFHYGEAAQLENIIKEGGLHLKCLPGRKSCTERD
jgi:hypothetical protein